MQVMQYKPSFLGAVTATVVASAAIVCVAVGAETESTGIVILDEVLTNEERISEGKTIWDANCTYCHGSKAYPGKAPKLRPHLYKPDFVYSRIADGFRGMPGWSETYNPDEIESVVAYVLSPKFAP